MKKAHSASGSALVIVLAFVVLLSGLAVAFLSRAVSERQISNSSASGAKVMMFTEGAISTIVGDLKSEIAAGSNSIPVTTPNASPVTTTIYIPKAPANAVPQRVGTADAWPNLVKTSAYSSGATPFYAVGSNNGPARAANSSTDKPSLNGRYVSAKRWNSHYLLPKKPTKSDGSPNDTDATPYAASGTAFVVPKWILVATDGTNPTAVPATTDPTAAPTVAIRPVVGRFAYAIYDEGGLLDINAAGVPLDGSATTSPSAAFMAQSSYKSSLAYADLRYLTDASGNPFLTDAQINALAGRRSYLSSSIDPTNGNQTPLGGSFPNYTWTATNLKNYFLFNLGDSSGFLAPSRLPQLSSNNNVYDRRVLTRQEMLNLMLRGLMTGDDPAARSKIQDALQYLTSYSRGLNQPSYAPVSRVSGGSNSNPRPMIQPSTTGGNNVADADAYTTADLQDKLSPNFLTIRAQAAFTRNDGTTALIGEPLVKKRFALQRLAWLTYKGASARRNGVGSGSPTDPDTIALVAGGVPVTLLQQGTDENILKYFGLRFDYDHNFWSYAGHNRLTSGTNGDAQKGAIHRLDEVATLGTREPDFFELLKASIDPGSLAKASIMSSTADPGGVYAPLNIQFNRDISLDAAIIQIGANVIDQFDTDGYPTRILLDDNSGKPVREFRGVENLPYLYRIYPSVLMARLPVPTWPLSGSNRNMTTAYLHSDSTKTPKSTSLTDTGVGVLLAVPDLWNPHDQNGSLGNPRPGTDPASVRIIADSAAPDYIGTSTVHSLTVGGYAKADSSGNYKGNDFDAPYASTGGGVIPIGSVTPSAPVFSRTPTSATSAGTPMTDRNGSVTNYGYTVSDSLDQTTGSTLLFNVPDATLFREPTLMGTANVAGCGLSMYMTNPNITGLQDGGGAVVYTTASGGYKGLRSLDPNTTPYSAPGSSPSQTTPALYTGMYVGMLPFRWVGGRYANSDQASTGWVYNSRYMGLTGNPIAGITYRLQYKDEAGNWATYDEKYTDMNYFWNTPVNGFVQPQAGIYTFIDPRTARFGAPNESAIDASTNVGSRYYRSPIIAAHWLDSVGHVHVTERPDYHGGYGANYRGTYSGSDWAAFTALGWHYRKVNTASQVDDVFLETGMLSQNNPYQAADGYRYNGDAGVGTLDPIFYSDADGVVRRAMGAHVSVGSTSTVGLPLVTASTYTGGTGRATATAQSQSRPRIFNRPFRSVAELGAVFTGNPWKNLDFSTAESGYAGLLDVFCVSDTDDPDALVAGRLNLNTRQPTVLKAMLAGAYINENNSAAPTATLPAADAATVANLLIARTSQQPAAGPNASNGPQPLANIGELAGRWNSRQAITYTNYTPGLSTIHNIDGKLSFDGFSADLATLASSNALNSPISSVRETAVRSLASVGNTRVWNLMIDVVAQTGRYPSGATDVNNFKVEGEQRCWVHLAIDRNTGQVIDRKLEVVKE